MKGKKCITIGCIITLAVAVWFTISMAYSTKLTNYFSTFKLMKSEGDNAINYYSAENNQKYDLGSIDTLVLPLHFDRQIFRVGIYMGEQTDGTGEYDFQIEDEFGNILGKTVVGIEKIRQDSFVYINIPYAVISLGQTYYLKIFATDPNTGTAPLSLVVSDASAFQTLPFSVNGAVSDKTVILDYRYSAIDQNILLKINVFLSAVLVLYWIIYALRHIFGKKQVQIRDFFKNIPWRKINVCAIGILFIFNAIIFLMPQKSYLGVSGNERLENSYERAIPLGEEAVEQAIKADEGIADSLGVMFATYNQKVRGGTVCVEMQNESDNQTIYSAEIETDEIEDNKYYYFTLPNEVNLGNDTFYIKLSAKLASESDALAVYLNDKYSETMYAKKNGASLDGSIIFKLCKLVKLQRLNLFIIVDGILLILLLLYAVKFANFHNEFLRYASFVFLLTLLLYLPVSSLVVYNDISMNSISAVLRGESKLAVFKQYDEEELSNAFFVEKKYDYQGNEYEHMESLDIPFNGTVSRISLDFDGEKLAKEAYDINVYWDSGKGFNDKQSFKYPYIHRGGNNITFPVPCKDVVSKLKIGIGKIFDYSYSERLIPIKTVRVNFEENNIPNNGMAIIKNILIALFAMGALCIITFIWKYYVIDEKLDTFLENIKITISIKFAIIASIYGILMLFLIPSFQIPDERGHISMLFTDLGDSKMEVELDRVLLDNGASNVMRKDGQVVDIPKYISASENKLEDYSFQRGFPSVRLLRRPGQAMGVTIGQLLHLPAYWILQLGELGALIAYIALGIVTLKLMPYKKNVMMAIMLLPMAIQQAGSISYDSFTNATAFLMIAYIFHLKADAEKVSWNQIAKLLCLTFLLLVCKVVYVLLLGLVLIIPIEKLELRTKKFTINSDFLKKHKISISVFILAGIPVFIAGSILLLSVMGYGNVLHDVIDIASGFPQFARVMYKATAVHSNLLINGTICTLGYFDVPVSEYFIWMIVFSLFIFSFMRHKQQDAYTASGKLDGKLSAVDIIVCYAIFAMTFVAIFMALSTWGFRIYAIDADKSPFFYALRLLPRIEGVQGRYFLPILPLLFIPLHTKKDFLKFIPRGLYKICYYLIVVIYPISRLLARYWGIGNL